MGFEQINKLHFVEVIQNYIIPKRTTTVKAPLPTRAFCDSKTAQGWRQKEKTTKSKHVKNGRVTDVTNERLNKLCTTIEVSWAKEGIRKGSQGGKVLAALSMQ